MEKRKICVVTGTRADYGLLYWLMKEICDDHDLELQIIATGMHLSPEFGLTYRVIEQDGFDINAKVEMVLSSDTEVGVGKSIGIGIMGFTDVLDRLKPDVMVVLGDRYEILAAVQAALVLKIPTAHISGGETTEGAVDEAIRHSITKMSHIHFVGAEPYRKRVIQLGENPSCVFNYGDPGLDNIRKLKLLKREELEKEIQFKLAEITFLVTYHPVTLSQMGPEETMTCLIQALDSFREAKVIFTKPNSDAGGRTIIRMIDEYVAKHQGRVVAYTSLGQIRYLSAMMNTNVVIGNSSSGIVEAPALNKPTVNIGDRQKGRLKASSIIDCGETTEEIIAAIQTSISSEFQRVVERSESLYGYGDASHHMKETLKTIELNNIVMKKFYDL